MPVSGFGPFAVAAAVGVYLVVSGLFSVYLYILSIARIQFSECLQLIDSLAEKLNCVFVVSKIAMRYFQRLVIIERNSRYLEDSVRPGEVVMLWRTVEVR